jgi:uncharacterized SAM-binding protein YcdF (DUF218 family)
MNDLYFLMTTVLQPYLLGIVLTGVVLGVLLRKAGGARRRLVLLTPFAGLVVISLPAVSYLARGTLEWQRAPLVTRPAQAEAIVVLAGSIQQKAPGRSEFEPSEDTLYRCVEAARLYRQGEPCPVVVSGGRVAAEPGEPSCAEVMHDFLIAVGVSPADVLVEDQSSTTYENALNTARLLRDQQIDTVVLVTDALHMVRAERCFRKQGLSVIPAPCNYRATHFQWSLPTFLPDPHTAQGSQKIMHEWVGTLWYWCRGRF